MPYFEPQWTTRWGQCHFPSCRQRARDVGRDDTLVDADNAVFEPLGDAPDAADIAAVEIGGKAEFDVKPPYSINSSAN